MYTLVIDDVVEFPVKFTLKSGKVSKPFAMTLTARRMAQDEIRQMLSDKERDIADFLQDVLTGWADQRLVLGEDGQPAPFSPEALAVLLNVAGVAAVCFGAYFKECGAKEKN